MMGTRTRGLLVVGLVGLLLAGCTSPGEKEADPGVSPEEVAPEAPQSTTRSGPDSGPSAQPEGMKPVVVNRGPKRQLEIPGFGGDGRRTLSGLFYFDFDQTIVKRGGHEELNEHAQHLAESGDRVRIEGHADERGTREYNMALGERRANAVRAYLVAQGVGRSQVEVVSFGEERKAEMGDRSNERSWALNRRVEVAYK
jgi:peptidoglycan-associated lipoprotein